MYVYNMMRCLLVVGDLLAERSDLLCELLHLRRHHGEGGGGRLDDALLLIALVDGLRHLLVAEALLGGLGLGVGLELGEEVLDEGADLDEVVLRGVDLHGQCGEDGAVELGGLQHQEGLRLLRELGLGRGGLAAAQLQERRGLVLDPGPVALGHGRHLDQAVELLVRAVVRLHSLLEGVHGLGDGRELGGASIGALVEDLGLQLALLGQDGTEGLVGRLVLSLLGALVLGRLLLLGLLLHEGLLLGLLLLGELALVREAEVVLLERGPQVELLLVEVVLDGGELLQERLQRGDDVVGVVLVLGGLTVGRLSYVLLWVSCVLARSSRISPEFHRNFIRISPEFHRNFTRITRISPEVRQNIELEHLKKGDYHNSAFPQA